MIATLEVCMDARDAIRPNFKPEIVRVLLVGESLSASGTFFYNVDSNLYRYTCEAFSLVFGDRSGTGQEFIEFFRKLGFYLDDLCLEPVNRMPERVRKQKRLEGISSLSSRIREFEPSRVIAVMKPIEMEVREAVRQSGLAVPVVSLPFPAQSNQRSYVQGFSELLRVLLAEKIIQSH